jgi:hypothetical protein
MDGRNMIALLPFWLLVAPPVLAIVSAMMDGTMRRDRDFDRDRDLARDRRPVT